MTEPIIKSEKLTTLLGDLAKLKARAKQSSAEVQRLTKITHPQYLEATVRTVVNEKEDINRHDGVTNNGVDEKDAAARKAEELRRTLVGQPLADLTSVEEQLRAEHRQWAAIEEAVEFCYAWDQGREDRARSHLLQAAQARSRRAYAEIL